jgi:hypothetical protein
MNLYANNRKIALTTITTKIPGYADLEPGWKEKGVTYRTFQTQNGCCNIKRWMLRAQELQRDEKAGEEHYAHIFGEDHVMIGQIPGVLYAHLQDKMFPNLYSPVYTNKVNHLHLYAFNGVSRTVEQGRYSEIMRNRANLLSGGLRLYQSMGREHPYYIPEELRSEMYMLDLGSDGTDCVQRIFNYICPERKSKMKLAKGYTRCDEVIDIRKLLEAKYNDDQDLVFTAIVDMTIESHQIKGHGSGIHSDQDNSVVFDKWEKHIQSLEGCNDVLSIVGMSMLYDVNLALIYDNRKQTIIVNESTEKSDWYHTIHVFHTHESKYSHACLTRTYTIKEDNAHKWTTPYVVTTQINNTRHVANLKCHMWNVICNSVEFPIAGPGFLLQHTNARRSTQGQANLSPAAQQEGFDAHAHDPGEFRHMNVLCQLSNANRNLASQPNLSSSNGTADRAMYENNFHDPDDDLLKMNAKESSLESRIQAHFKAFQGTSEDDEDAPSPYANAPEMYISRLFAEDAKSDFNVKSLLWDSGATQHVFGKGAMQDRLKQNLLVVNDAAWIKASDQDRRMPHCERKRINVVVANGQSVLGEEVPQIDVEVRGEVLNHNGSKRRGIKKTILSMYYVVSTAGINTCVVAEAHFMQTNPNVTLITQGSDKWIVWGKVNFTYEAIDGNDPVKIKLRYHNGAHYLDIGGAVQNQESLATGTVERNEYPVARVNMMHTNTLAIDTESMKLTHASKEEGCCVSTQTDIQYEEIASATAVFVPAQRKAPYSTMGEANCDEDEMSIYQETTMAKISRSTNYSECLENTHRVIEDPESTNEERLRAIEDLEIAASNLNTWIKHYAHVQKTTVFALHTAQGGQTESTTLRRSTRLQSLKERKAVMPGRAECKEEMWMHHGDVWSNEKGDEIYKDYDEVHRASVH